jgi:uncharacterized protein (DUF1778 family)
VSATAANKIINFRASAAKQTLIDQAARVAGKSRTDFILDASCEKAREVLADQTHFALDRQAMKRFNQLIDAPPDLEALRDLLATPAPWDR